MSNERFVINKEDLQKVIQEFKQKYDKFKDSKNENDLIDLYVNRIISILGNENLIKAIGNRVLRVIAQSILFDKPISMNYADEESFYMLEGLSNKEVVGDWQHFLTIKPDFLFSFPESQQEKIANNFSIGNESAKNCLLELWKKHIETRGVDILRPEWKGSSNYIALAINKETMSVYIEVLAKLLPSKGVFLGEMYNEKK